jgi:hypothetical protein
MEILRSTDFVDYFSVSGLGMLNIVNFISNGKTEQHDLSDGHPKEDEHRAFIEKI